MSEESKEFTLHERHPVAAIGIGIIYEALKEDDTEFAGKVCHMLGEYLTKIDGPEEIDE